MPTVATYLKFANLQMAAEATELDQYLAGSLSLKTALTDGNERRSRFTSGLADQFVSDQWTVLDYKADTGTGFSGTLFKYDGPTDASRDLTNGELVLSFRSTEFIDDAARDSEATNSLEIKATGWAFGQIADMQKWFANLDADPAKLKDKSFSVTGYSLGGHLATAFDLLMQDKGPAELARVTATYTFNGAGVGEVKAGHTLTEAVAAFNAHKTFGSNADLFSDPVVGALYGSLSTLLGSATPTRSQLYEAWSWAVRRWTQH